MILRLFTFLAIGLATLSPHAAEARARVFFGFGGPVFLGPPMYYPPPVYVVPPPAYYPPPVTYIQRPDTIQPAPQLSCDAGPYVCPLPRPASPGAACSCPTEKGRINGVVR